MCPGSMPQFHSRGPLWNSTVEMQRQDHRISGSPGPSRAARPDDPRQFASPRANGREPCLCPLSIPQEPDGIAKRMLNDASFNSLPDADRNEREGDANHYWRGVRPDGLERADEVEYELPVVSTPTIDIPHRHYAR